MKKPKITLTKQRGNYYAVSVDGVPVGYCQRSRNFMAENSYAGWDFKPRETSGLKGAWETTPKRAVEAALRLTEEAKA